MDDEPHTEYRIIRNLFICDECDNGFYLPYFCYNCSFLMCTHKKYPFIFGDRQYYHCTNCLLQKYLTYTNNGNLYYDYDDDDDDPYNG